jgi:hypothetical protein
MSKSEKMRYSKDIPSPFSLANYTDRLEKIMEKQPSGVAQTTLKNFIQRDRSILYEMIARFVPMGTTAEVLAFLQAFIAEEKNGDDIIGEDGEVAVERIATAFLERGSELIHTGAYLDAAGIAFAIILAIEPELCFVYDEGWTYQMVIADAFDFLTQISNQHISSDIFDSLLQIANGFYNGRREEDRYFDHKWEDAILIFKNRCSHKS